MNDNRTSIAEDAERLPAAERIKLVEQILDSLDKVDPAIEAAWADEAQSRLAAYEEGTIGARPADDVLT
ncbi:MAG: addiction module protein, partial [Hyphomicrobiaceae bacterium]